MKKANEQRRHQAEWMLRLRGLVRRTTLGVTSEIFRWAVKGFVDDENNEESDDAEVFQGVGFASRPPSDSNAEVIVVNVGAQGDHPVIVASRDEDTRREILSELNADESAMFNSQCVMLIDDGGVIRQGSRAASQSAVKGDAYTDAEKVFLTALKVFVTATLAPSGAKTTMNAAIDVFTTAIETTALSAKVKLD